MKRIKPALMRFGLIVILLLLGTAALFLYPSSAAQGNDALYPMEGDAMWIWRAAPSLANSQEARDELFAFCANPPGAVQPIRTLYLFVTLMNTNSDSLRLFLRQAHEHGLTVHYLDGEPQWAFGMQRKRALDVVDRVIAFNKGGDPDERFDGIHFDVEPYVLPSFNRPGAAESYKEHMAEVYEKIQSEGDGLLYGIAMPTFYDTREDDLMEFLIDHTDYVSLMDYRDYAEAIIDGAKEEIAYADTVGKKVIVGIEVQPPNATYGVTSRFTFYEEGWRQMGEELAEVNAAFESNPSYNGIAYHSYAPYTTLPEEPQPVERVNLPELTCVPAPDNMKIDGDLGEWAGLPKEELNSRVNLGYIVNGRAWKGPEDFSADVWTAWDQKGLYFAVSVRDDVFYRTIAGGEELWRDDHVEIWIDADLDGDLMSNKLSGDDYQLIFAPASAELPAVFLISRPIERKGEEANSEVVWSTKREGEGYALEVMVPWSFLRVGDPSAIRGVGLMIDPSDTDDPRSEQKTLMSTSSRYRAFGDPTVFRIAPLLKMMPAAR